MNSQFRVGIQTIAIIPVLPRGVLQLGSTSLVRLQGSRYMLKKVDKSLNFARFEIQ